LEWRLPRPHHPALGGRPGAWRCTRGGQQALLAALGQIVRLRIVWDELASLGTQVGEWLTPRNGARDIVRGSTSWSSSITSSQEGGSLHGSVTSSPACCCGDPHGRRERDVGDDRDFAECTEAPHA
jgi:hypothetical protein